MELSNLSVWLIMGTDCSPPKYHAALWAPITHGKLFCFLHLKALNCLLATLKHIFHSSQQIFAKAVFWNYKCGFKIVPWGLTSTSTNTLMPFSPSLTCYNLDMLHPHHAGSVIGGCTNCCSTPEQQEQHGLPTTWNCPILPSACRRIRQAAMLTSSSLLQRSNCFQTINLQAAALKNTTQIELFVFIWLVLLGRNNFNWAAQWFDVEPNLKLPIKERYTICIVLGHFNASDGKNNIILSNMLHMFGISPTLLSNLSILCQGCRFWDGALCHLSSGWSDLGLNILEHPVTGRLSAVFKVFPPVNNLS